MMSTLNQKMRRKLHKRVNEGIKRGNRIGTYWHCKKCCAENLYPNIAVGFTDVGFQVWCENHNINMVHYDLCGNKVKEIK